jgi:hypothetical protein
MRFTRSATKTDKGRQAKHAPSIQKLSFVEGTLSFPEVKILISKARFGHALIWVALPGLSPNSVQVIQLYVVSNRSCEKVGNATGVQVFSTWVQLTPFP